MEDNNKLVYFEHWAHEYREIESEWVKDTSTILKYFGNSDIDDKLNDDGEFIIYKLVPFARITKNVEYKMQTEDE